MPESAAVSRQAKVNLLRNILGSCWSALGRALKALKPKRKQRE